MAEDTNNRPILAFTNGKGEAKKLDVRRSIEEFPSSDTLTIDLAFNEPRDLNDFLYACPRTPLAPITFSFFYDINSTTSNFVNKQGIQFTYQNVYKDGSVSAIAPYSDLAVPPAIFGLGTSSIGEKSIENVCNLSIPYQGSEVEFVNLIFREGNDGVPFLFDKIPNNDSSKNPNYTWVGQLIMGTYSFRNDKTGIVLSEIDRFKTFDNLPREPKAQTVADDRLIYGNYKEGYNNANVEATLSVELTNAPAPGYSFEVTAYPYVFRENVAQNTDYGTNSAARSNSGFVVDFSKCPEEILPGTYALNVLFAPSQNYHIFTGAGDALSLDGIPEKKPFTGAPVGSGSNSRYPRGENAASVNQYHAALVYNGSQFNGNAASIQWDGEDQTSAAGVTGPGYTLSAPVIVKGQPIEFKVTLKVTEETTRQELEDSFAHVLYGLPHAQTPLVLNGNGSVELPTSEIECANVEVEVDLGFEDQDFFFHETSNTSDLVCAFAGGGFFIINRAKLRFFLETGNNCVGVSAGKVEFDDQVGIGSGYGMKICLAHMTDVDVKTCIPTPDTNFGSYVLPQLNPADGSDFLPGLEGVSIPGADVSGARRTAAAGTSVYDYFVDVNGTRLICWPDQRKQFDPDLTNNTPNLYGPAQRASLNSYGLGGYSVSSPKSYARRSETPDFGPGSGLAGENSSYLPAPIKRWYVFDNLKNRFSDQQWYDNFGIGLAYDVVGGDNGSATASDLLVTGNPSTFFGIRSKNWVGEIINLDFDDSTSGVNYCRIGLQRAYATPAATNITSLLADESNKLSLVDGTCGPGGLNGYAYNKFGEMGEKWEILGTSLEGYQGLKSLDVKSGNTRGSVNAFHLAGYANGLPFLERPGPLRRIFKQSDSFQGIGFTDDAFGAAISGSALYNMGVWAFYGQSDFPNNYSVPFENSAYTYGLNSDLTSEFPESTANTFPPPASVVNLFDPTFPATPGGISGVIFNQRATTQAAPPSAGSGGLIPASSISSNIGISGGFSYKTSASHEFGIVYFDERGRHGSVQPVGSVYVPGYSGQERPTGQLGAAKIRLKIKSTPPPWAKSYKVVYAGNSSVSEFIQYSTNIALLEKDADTNLEQSRIYVSLNYLQTSEVSYAESYGAISQDDGTKFLYRFAPGDRLTINQYSSESGGVLTPARPTSFRVLDVVTLSPDMDDHPLFSQGGDPQSKIERSGEFVIIEDNPSAEGFSVADIQAGTSLWQNRVIFEISRPKSSLSEDVRPYYETNYGGQITTGGNHQYTEFLMSDGDVVFRQVPVNSNSLSSTGSFTSNILGEVEDPTRFKSDFVGYFLETEGVTDLYRSDAKNYGRTHFVDSSAAEYNRTSTLTFSEKTFTGSSDVNYFSFPQIGNFKDLPISNGGIQRLYSDNVLLTAYQSSKTSLIPVSRDVLQTGGDDLIVKSSKVLGTPTELSTSYSIHDNPESLIVVDGDHFFFDKRSKKVIMLKGGKQAVPISDIRVDSYVSKITDVWMEDEWRALLGYDPDANELLFALVTQSDLNGSANGSLFGTLAFDMKTKKYWKTRYSYISQFFSKAGGKLVGAWTKPASNDNVAYMFNTAGASKNTFFGADSAAPTTFTCVSNQSPESVKEFVMLNSVADKYVDASVSTDQTSNSANFKIWKDYDGVKYAEVPKKPASPQDLGRSQRSNWLPTYPALESSYPGNVISFKNELGSSYVYTKMYIPLSSPLWRSPIPTGKKTFLVEATQGLSQNFYACGEHPDSEVIFDRSASIHSVYKDGSSNMGVIEFRMPWSVFWGSVGGGVWLSQVNTPPEYSGDNAAFRGDLVNLVQRIASENSHDDVTGNFPSAFEIDASDEANWSANEIANLARLFIVPMLSCTKINAEAAKMSYLGSLPTVNVDSDLDDDGVISTADLLLILAGFNNPDPAVQAQYDVTGDGFINTADILQLLSDFGGTVDTGTVVEGCTDPAATNYDPSANVDNGSCAYDPVDPGDGGGGAADLNLWWLAAQSQNKQIYVGYSNDVDGVHMKGRYASIDITSYPSGGELNLESLLVDFNALNKNPGQGVLNNQGRKKK